MDIEEMVEALADEVRRRIPPGPAAAGEKEKT
jgi:hypothetical protein